MTEIQPWVEAGDFDLEAARADPAELRRQVKALYGWWDLLQNDAAVALHEYAEWDHTDDQQHGDAYLWYQAQTSWLGCLAKDLYRLRALWQRR